MNKEEYKQHAIEAKQLFDQINKTVQQRIPEYGSIYRNCSNIMSDLESCIKSNNNQQGFKGCEKLIQNLRICTDKATCPEEFLKLSNCLNNNGNLNCEIYNQNLQNCLKGVSEKVLKLTKEEFINLTDEKQRQRLKPFLPLE